LVASGGDFAILTGHGSPDEQSGQDAVNLWTAGKYSPDQTQGKVIKLLSCDTGLELVPDLITYGKAKAALGYDADYLWLGDPGYYLHPYDDPLAAMCLKPVIAGLNALLDGCTAQQSLDIERAGYLANMENTDSELIQALLQWNLNHGVLYGSGSATIQRCPHFTIPIPPPPLIF
jgi:hypothetical protein